MNKKVLAIVIICLSVLLVSGDLFAKNKPKFFTAEGSVLVGFLGWRAWEGPPYSETTEVRCSGMFTMGVFIRNIIGLEASAFLMSANRPSDSACIVYSLNVTLNIPLKKFSLFATIGAGHRPANRVSEGDVSWRYPGDLHANIGGGVKIRLKNKWGIRVEYRTWPGLEEGKLGDSILGGVSYFF